MPFAAERDLLRMALCSSDFRSFLSPDWPPAFWCTEPDGLFGIPDLVVAKMEAVHQRDDVRLIVLAFELKLSAWKRALVQAYRYQAFAHLTYVLLDNERIGAALTQIDRFHRSNIGLLGLNSRGRLFIYHLPRGDRPYSPSLAAQFESTVIEHLQQAVGDNALCAECTRVD